MDFIDETVELDDFSDYYTSASSLEESSEDNSDSEAFQNETEYNFIPNDLKHIVEDRSLSHSGRSSSLAAPELLELRSVGLGCNASRMSRKIAAFDIFPSCPSKVVDRMDSRGYIGQYTPNGDYYIGAFQGDRVIKLYDTNRDFRVSKIIHARNLRWTITDTAISPCKKFIIYSSITPLVHLVNIDNDLGIESIANVTDIHETLRFSRNGSEGLWSVKWSSDNREIIAGSSECIVYVYDIATQQVVSKLRSHQEDVNAVEYCDETSKLFFSGSDDSYIHVWDRRLIGVSGTGNKPVGSLIGHTEGIAHLNSKRDSNYLISNGKDQKVKCWDLRAMSSWKAAKDDRQQRDIPRFRWDYRWMPYPGNVKRVRHPRDGSVSTYIGHTVISTLCRAYWSPLHSTGQRYIYTGCATGTIHIYDVVTGEKVKELVHHDDVVRDCSWHPYQPTLTSIAFDGTIVQWEHM